MIIIAAEIWKPVKGYEGLYEVSNMGSVRNSKTGKLKIPQLMKRGYVQVLLWTNHQAKGFTIHRLVAEAFLPNPNNFSDVNHKDGNKQNNSVDNLEWCTRSYNLKHAYKNGLRVSSSQKLTIEQVKFIRNNFDSFTRYEFARMFDVSYWSICNVLQGRCFKGVN